jgi:hypothetical protein
MTKDSNGHPWIPVNDDFIEKVQEAIEVALAYEELTKGKRHLGITGTVGEILACYELSLRLTPDSRSKGYDAFDANDKQVEIKTRRSESKDLPKDSGRVSTFSKHKFDYALLVLLDRQYQVSEIWQASYTELLPIINKQKKRNPSLSAFKEVAYKIFSPDQIRKREYHKLPIPGYSDSIRGTVIQRWLKAREPHWDLKKTVEICEKVDDSFLRRGLNPAKKFRYARGVRDTHYVSEWVRRCRFPWLGK